MFQTISPNALQISLSTKRKREELTSESQKPRNFQNSKKMTVHLAARQDRDTVVAATREVVAATKDAVATKDVEAINKEVDLVAAEEATVEVTRVTHTVEAEMVKAAEEASVATVVVVEATKDAEAASEEAAEAHQGTTKHQSLSAISEIQIKGLSKTCS